jgi:hypothetical protein
LPVTDQDLFSFVSGAVRSVWGLELLLLLKREPERAWSADALVRELRASTTVVADSLSALETAGVVVHRADGYAYGPASALLDRLCGELERAYRERPVTVINAIVSPNAKLQGFANAFRLREKE